MTSDRAVPTNQPCPSCNALVFYEGHSELKTSLTPHRFHCHSCGKLYVVRSTSHNAPKFPISEKHEARDAEISEGQGNHEHVE